MYYPIDYSTIRYDLDVLGGVSFIFLLIKREGVYFVPTPLVSTLESMRIDSQKTYLLMGAPLARSTDTFQ